MAKKKTEAVDPRHGPVRRAIQEMWQEANFGTVCPWNGMAASRLKKLLEENRTWTPEHFIRCARNRFASEDMNPSAAPGHFIPKLPDYLGRPLNTWGKPMAEKPAMRKVIEDDDVKGYRWLTRNGNEKLLAEFRKSGLSASEFMSRKRKLISKRGSDGQD